MSAKLLPPGFGNEKLTIATSSDGQDFLSLSDVRAILARWSAEVEAQKSARLQSEKELRYADNAIGDARKKIAALEAEVERLRAQKDGAYSERDKVVAAFAHLALAAGMKAWTARHVGEPWDEDWRGIVFIELPTGQTSWHYHDSEHHLFADLPTSGEPWDGHSTPEKYERLKAATYDALAPESSSGGAK